LRRNYFLKLVVEGKTKGKGWGAEEEEVNSYGMTLRKRKDTGI